MIGDQALASGASMRLSSATVVAQLRIVIDWYAATSIQQAGRGSST